MLLLSSSGVTYCVGLIKDILDNNTDLSIAVLSPFKRSVLALQEGVGETVENKNFLLIETVDRVQGLTVDICIYYLSLDNPTFALNLQRFNVATSRAKYGTVIITDKEFVRFNNIDSRVTSFITNSESVDLL